MHVIICLDDRSGMLFNRRRLSSDRAVCERIVELAEERTLWMNAYSAKLFDDQKVTVSDTFLENAEPGDVCFVENVDILPYMDKLGTVTVFSWNRAYPSDTKFPIVLLDNWQKSLVSEFAGSSHEKISEWRYVR